MGLSGLSRNFKYMNFALLMRRIYVFFRVLNDGFHRGKKSGLMHVEAGTVVKADTVEELANAIGISAAGLASTLATWNADCAKGVDTTFGKTECLNPIEVGPFYAAKTGSYNLGTMGGLKINTDAQVCRFDGTPIEHLYAGGLCTGGWAGQFYPGSGTAILSTVHWGRKAGRNAAANDNL